MTGGVEDQPVGGNTTNARSTLDSGVDVDGCLVHLFHEREVFGDYDVGERQVRLRDLDVVHRRAARVDVCAEQLELAELGLRWDVADLVETGTGPQGNFNSIDFATFPCENSRTRLWGDTTAADENLYVVDFSLRCRWSGVRWLGPGRSVRS